MLGNTEVSNLEAEVSHIKLATEFTYVNAKTDIRLDYTTKNILFGRDGAEPITLGDAFSKTIAYSRTFSDSITAEDTPNIGQIYRPEFDNTFSIGDQIAVAIQYNLEFSDSISSISDSLSWNYGKNVDDSITTSDTPGIGAIHKVSPTDSITTSDTPGIGAIHVVTPSDSVEASDVQMLMHDGMLNTNMLNARLISAGDTQITGTNVTIT